MSDHARPPTDSQKEQALLHANVWENVFHVCKENAERRLDINRDLMSTLATFALIVGSEYRRVANGNNIEP